MNKLLLGAGLAVVTSLVAAPARRSTWDLRQFNWVKLMERERGAEPNAHPARIQPEALRAVLESVMLADGAEPLFSRDDLDRFQGPLAEALALATADEDVVVFCTSRRDAGILAPELTVTARLFVKGDRLNLLVGETRLEFAGPARAHVTPPLPGYGSRAGAGQAVLKAERAQSLRPDWLVFPLPEPRKVAEPPRPVQTGVRSVPLQIQGAKAPAEERLRTLKRLREDGLITDEEYREKRKEILKEL
ncbi:SHOCT domain-containing protein [Mesoterricola sediminis]|uniref:SHOCT domain-containing protein n=1 Tax=Mesoterricola sediminis TaxID=2927980 RepID=A0AA48GTE9_9BACT|nr:SHOCT domain-containing protein [Mesoterricola sediminis]BDU75854.1 hypothetical protein METESE_08120 [Mesoterricola sediminis]